MLYDAPAEPSESAQPMSSDLVTGDLTDAGQTALDRGYLYRQGAITKKMVRLAARLLSSLGKPTTDEARARFAQVAYRNVNEARRESYVLAVRNMAHTVPGVEPAPLRPLQPQGDRDDPGRH